MNATELYLKDGKPTHIFYCEKCRYISSSQELAEQCCKNYQCSQCGKDTGQRAWTICDDCRAANSAEKERERFEKAEKLSDWDGWVYLEGTGNDGYHQSLSDFYDNWADDHDEGGTLPEYVWSCRPNHFVRADVSDITERMDDEAYEDFDPETLNGLPELKAAIETFNAANASVCSYEPDYSKAILISDSAPVSIRVRKRG